MIKTIISSWAAYCQFIPLIIYVLSSQNFRKQKDVIAIVIVSIVGLLADFIPYHDKSVNIEIYDFIEFICFLLFFYVTKPSFFSKFVLKILLATVFLIRIALLTIDKKFNINFPFLVFGDIFFLFTLIIYFYRGCVQPISATAKLLPS